MNKLLIIPAVLLISLLIVSCSSVESLILTVSNIYPLNGSTVSENIVDLKWQVSSGADKFFNIYFGDFDSPPKVENDYDRTSYSVNNLIPNKKYYWKIEYISSSGNTVDSPLYNFTVAEASSHGASNPTPFSGQPDVRIDTGLSWDSAYESGCSFIYDVYYGTDLNNLTKATTTTDNKYTPPLLESMKEYFWKIVSRSSGGESFESVVWNFFTTASPFSPDIPDPADKSILNTLEYTLKWNTYKSEYEEVSYDIYFGSDASSLVLVSQGQLIPEFVLNGLSSGGGYFWKVDVNYENGGFCESPLWNFKIAEGMESLENESPSDKTEIAENNVVLRWKYSGKSEGCLFKIYFSENSEPEFFGTVIAGNGYTISGLDYGKTYYWKISVETGTGIFESEVTEFKVKSLVDNPPYPPSNPDPGDNCSNVNINTPLIWECTDPENDRIYFDVYIGLNASEIHLEASNLNTCFFSGEEFDYEKKYYWKIVAKDEKGRNVNGPVWTFMTQNIPVQDLPDINYTGPSYDAVEVPLNAILMWNSANSSSYDVYISESVNPVYVASTTDKYYSPNLEKGKTYYWKVVAKNSEGETSGGIWKFTTVLPQADMDFIVRNMLLNIQNAYFVESVAFDAPSNSGMINFNPNLLDSRLVELYGYAKTSFQENSKVIFPLEMRVAGEKIGDNFLIGRFSSFEEFNNAVNSPDLSGITIKQLLDYAHTIKFKFKDRMYTIGVK